jgi:serine/threonine protein kinase
MSTDRWRRVRDLFDEAVELPPAEQAAFLDELGAGDEGLRGEVASLLRASAASGEFLETPALSHVAENPFREDERSRIGPYAVLRELGHGGMGTVYLAARRDQGFEKTVAVKLVRRGMDTDFVLERFSNERRILADLDHPNIARILDGGSTEDGLPYFVMEYIPGRHLLDEASERGLSVRERLLLFQKVCGAVAYAHRHLVVHRDIKPSNILVTPDGEPKLLDFGLARVLQPDLSDGEGDRTATALRFLTPDYASPEQVRGERIATSSDIYSLGVVLYELLVGKRPYRTTGAGVAEIARAVCEQEPPRPGAVVPALRGDCDNIVMTALRKEPERRYASVEAFSDDIGRHLDGRPIHARKDTFGYRAGKFIARHKAGVAATVGRRACSSGPSRPRSARPASHRAARDRRGALQRRAASSRTRSSSSSTTRSRTSPGRRRRAGSSSGARWNTSRSSRRSAARTRGSSASSRAPTSGSRASRAACTSRTWARRRARARASSERSRSGGACSPPAVPPADDRIALAEAELQLCQVLLVTGDGAQALSAARGAVDILQALSANAPADASLTARAARARRYLGTAHGAAGDHGQSLRELRAARDAFAALAAAHPSEASYRRELGVSHQHILYALAGTSERAEAETSYAEACRLLEALDAERPDLYGLRRELAYTHVSMGTFCEWSDDYEGALRFYSRALPLLDTLVRQDPKNADVRLLLAEDCNSVGYAMVRSGAAG